METTAKPLHCCITPSQLFWVLRIPLSLIPLTLFISTEFACSTGMRLRNFKETVEPTPEEWLRDDFQPRYLDEEFDWRVEKGSNVWVKLPEGKWVRGTAVFEEETVYKELRSETSWCVSCGRTKPKKWGKFTPMLGDMKPDSHEVRELLRQAGYFV